MATSLVTAPLEIGAGLLTSAGGSALGFVAVSAAVSGRAASTSSPMGLNVRMGVVALGGVCDGELGWLLPAAAAEAALTGGPNFSRILDTFTLEKVNLAAAGPSGFTDASGDRDDEEAFPEVLDEAGAAGGRFCGY